MPAALSPSAEIEKIIDGRFSIKNYLVKKEGHEKTLLCSENGDCIVRNTIKKPCDISVYRRLLGISSPHICNILDIGEDDGSFAVWEEYCEGMTLAEACEMQMSEGRAVDIALSVCEGLYAIHSCGVIHRDLKPENIILSDENSVKIIDYDAARVYKAGSSEDTRLLGTCGFAAPEQFGFGQTDVRTDIFSLAVVLNFMLTGSHPSVKLCGNKHISRVLRKCLAISAEDRYPNVEEVYADLKKARKRCKDE